MSRPKKRVAIIGAGTSGLPAIKSCIEDSLEPVCFEKRDDCGGLFYVQNPLPELDLQARIYHGMVLNTCKHFYCYSDFAPLKDSPYNLRSKDAKAYMDAYAKHFDLRKYIHFNTTVTRVAKAKDYESSGKWTVTTVDAKSGANPETQTFDSVIIASGYFTKARMPSLPGQDTFAGSVTHSGLFWDSHPYYDRTVCIVGAGFSAIDLAVILAQNCEQVYIVTRRGFWVLPLIIEGKAWEFYAFNRRSIETETPRTSSRSGETGDQTLRPQKLGINPQFAYAECAISNNFDEWLASGKIKVIHGELDHFEEKSVTLKDGREIQADDVIFATGFDPDCPWLDAPDLFPNTTNIMRNPHWEYVLPIGQRHPTLLMAGMIFSSGDLPPCAELQARLATSIISEKIKLPSEADQLEWFKKEKQGLIDLYGKYPAMTDSFGLMLDISLVIGCNPCISTIAERNQKLADQCFHGALIPAQFRLLGPHAKWEMAEKAILDLEGKEDMIVET